MNDLQSLRERVEKADGPDRELDCQLALKVGGFHLMERVHREPAYCTYTEMDGLTVPGQDGTMMVPHYTASIDSAVALIERKIPAEKRFFWQVGVCSIRDGRVVSYSAETNWTGEKEFEAKTPALALIAALLSALETHNG